MCGITGRVGDIADLAAARQTVERQLTLLRHRGPDGNGIAAGDGFVLGHVRLAIIDPALGAQPFESADGNLVITYNGEIYNYLELRDELRAMGSQFRTTSDTEVLLEGYRRFGPGILPKLDGMFAFAIYDRARRELFCARDPYGQKPFFWRQTPRELAFASETRAFACLPDFTGEVDLASVADFLAFECFPHDRSIYRGVRKLPPGHSLTYRDGEAIVRCWYESVPGAAPVQATEPQAVDRVAALLRRSVERTFRADVDVGLLLSGGIDSALVLSYLREVHPGLPLRTYTVRNVDPSFDESEPAALLARTFGTSHTEVVAEPGALADIAREAPALLDEPQADPGFLPKYLVCREIARDCKVALTGDGGDEFFYGYAIFRALRAARVMRALPAALHRGVVQPLTRMLPASDRYLGLDVKAKAFARGFPAPDALRNFYWTCAFSDRELPRLVRPGRLDASDVAAKLDLARERWARAAGSRGRLAYQYQTQYLPDYVLANSDRASMLHAVELRTPYLSPDLAAYANALPDELKMRGGVTKSLLRAVARNRLPEAILKRRKMGFTTPAAALVKGPLAGDVRDCLGPAQIARVGLFDGAYVGRIVAEHFANRHNHYKQIWALYMLQKWLLARGLTLG